MGENKMKIYCELDGVLYNNNHRADLRHDFSAYWESSSGDKVKTPVLQLLQSLSDESDIILFSCCPESYRYAVEERLRVDDVPCDDLLLRPNDDHQKENDLREEFVLGDGSLTKALKETRFILVNNESAVESFRDLGFQVFQGDFA